MKELPLAGVPLPPDLHIHTAYSEHAAGTMEETVQSAVAKGLTEIGFSDHFHYPEGYEAPAPNCVIPSEAAFKAYTADVKRLQSEYADQIRILFATEADFLDARPGIQAERLRPCGFDYVIGSVHIVGGVAIDYREDMLQVHLEKLGGIDRLWERYWDNLARMVEEGWCHVVGHLDILKKFSRFAVPRRNPLDPAEAVLLLIRDRDLALEVNTGGFFRASDGTPYPSLPFLKRAAELGVDVVFGSDAHTPSDVGRGFGEAMALMRSLGWRNAATFRAGRKQVVPLAA